MAKKACFHNFIAEHNPDIIAGCESWLSSLIQSAKVFPTGLKTYRRDRSDGYFGVFITCRETLISEELVHDRAGGTAPAAPATAGAIFCGSV